MITKRMGATVTSSLLLLAACGEQQINENDNFSLFLIAEGNSIRREYNLSMGECSARMEEENAQEPRNDWDRTRKWYCERQTDGDAI